MEAYFARMQDESYAAFLDMIVFNLPRPKSVSVPMLVMGAEDDKLFPRGDVEATARAYGTEATIFPNMAHDMMLEDDWKKVADHILGWLGERGI